MNVTAEIGLERLVNQVRDTLAISHVHVVDAALIGSQYIQGVGNDVDVLVLVYARNQAVTVLEHAGYAIEGEPSSGGPGDEFESLRRGEVNVLVTEDRAFYEKWIRAAEVCKYVHGRYGHCHKDDRVKIHQLIMDN